MPKANSRTAGERLAERPRERRRGRFSGTSFTEFGLSLFRTEARARKTRRLERGLKRSHLGVVEGLDGFDFPARPALEARVVKELLNCRFVEEHRKHPLPGSTRSRKDSRGQGHRPCRLSRGLLRSRRSRGGNVRRPPRLSGRPYVQARSKTLRQAMSFSWTNSPTSPSPPRRPTTSSGSSPPATDRVRRSSPPTPASQNGRISFPPRPPLSPPPTDSSTVPPSCASPVRASDNHARSWVPLSRTERHRSQGAPASLGSRTKGPNK